MTYKQLKEQAIDERIRELERIMDTRLERISDRLDSCLRAIIRIHKTRADDIEIRWDNAPTHIRMM